MKILNQILIFVFAAQVTHAAGTQGGDSTGTTTPSGPSVNQNANDSQSANDSGAASSMIMSGFLGVMAAKEAAAQNYGTAAMYAGMAILSAIQSGEHGDSANQAGNTALNSDGGPAKTLTSSGANSGGSLVSSDLFKKGLNGVKADMKNKTVTVNGKTYPASDFSSPAAMQAAGFSTDDIAKVMDAAVAAEKKITAKMGAGTGVNGFAEGGGGGGGVSYAEDSAAGAAEAGAGSAKDLSDRGPAAVTGMTKDFNGEPIGVAGDSIFEMMNRRYILKDKQNAFINENDVLLKQK